MMVPNAQERLQCPHCGKLDTISVYAQAHFGIITDQDTLYCKACFTRAKAWRFRPRVPSFGEVTQ